MTTATATKFSESDAAKMLGCNVQAFRSRQVALGLVKVCGRCGGSGKFSFNSMDGDRCYGCQGRGEVLLPVSRKLAEEMKRRQDAGELEAYFARNRARAEAKKQIAPLVAEVIALYEPIAQVYEVEYKAKHWSRTQEEIDPRVYLAQTMANSIRWGDHLHGRPAKSVEGMGVSEIESALKYGKVDAEAAVAQLEERVEMMKALRAAFDA